MGCPAPAHLVRLSGGDEPAVFLGERNWKKVLSPRKSYFVRELGGMGELKLPPVAFMQLAGPIPPLPLSSSLVLCLSFPVQHSQKGASQQQE